MQTPKSPRFDRFPLLGMMLAASCRDGAEPPSAKRAAAGMDVAGTPAGATAAVDDLARSLGDSVRPGAACRSHRDCATSETCCPAGLVGVCTPLDLTLGCPMPDLALAIPADFNPRIVDRFVAADDCLLQKCIGAQGARRLLTFPLDLIHRGDGAVVLALAGAPGVRRVSCRETAASFIDDFLTYELIDAEGVQHAIGNGDVSRSCQGGVAGDCENLGLEAQAYRSYAAGDDCQWVDITTLAAGQYTLRVSVNADGRLAERDTGNNVIERTVTVPGRDPLAPCGDDVVEAFLGGVGPDLECGWELVAGQTGVSCIPDEEVFLECTFCNGGYLPRVCPGVAPCSAASALFTSGFGAVNEVCTSEHTCDGAGQCLRTGFVCPAIGRYTLLGWPAHLAVFSAPPRTAPDAVTCEHVARPTFLVPPVDGEPLPVDAGTDAMSQSNRTPASWMAESMD